jgi:hypothetical protein
MECVGMSRNRRIGLTVGMAAVLLVNDVRSVSATEPPGNPVIATLSKPQALYGDVREDLLLAIEARGFVVGAIGDLGMMLGRSAPDFGRARVYLHAEYFNFCPAQLAHALAAADPANLGYCPFQMFMFEATANPGTIVVGYRRPGLDGNPATRAVLADAERLFAAIAKAAVK